MIRARYHCLDERDGLVVYDKPTLRKTIDLFRRVAPSLVFTHAPKDYMMDHEMASLLARAASFAYRAPNISTVAACARVVRAAPVLLRSLEGIDPLGAAVRPTTWIDISAQMDRKAEMLACHASQREWLHGPSRHGRVPRLDAAAGGDVAARKRTSPAAEAFVQHRGHAYPRDDMLDGLFGSATPSD